MKIIKRILLIAFVIVLAAVIGYFVYTGVRI